jgi:hypothetical protein
MTFDLVIYRPNEGMPSNENEGLKDPLILPPRGNEIDPDKLASARKSVILKLAMSIRELRPIV